MTRSDLLVLVVASITSILGIADDSSANFQRSWPTMGTYAELQTDHDSEDLNRRGEQIVRDVFERVNQTMSTWSEDSDLSRLNDRAGDRGLRVDSWLADLIQKGKRAHRVTDGAFSMDVLGYGVELGLKPGGDSYVLPPAGDDFVEVNASRSRVRLRRAGMGLDLGGVAKGYALDRAVKQLRDAGLNRFILSLGRAIYAGRAPRDRAGWAVAYRRGSDPERVESQYISVSEQGIRSDTGHIVDPRSGEPVSAERRVIVTGARGWVTDMASTALMVDPDLRPRLLRSYPSLQWVAVGRR